MRAPLWTICQELLGFGCRHFETDNPLGDEACDDTLDAVYAYLSAIA